MNNLLVLSSSLSHDLGNSSQLTSKLIDKLSSQHQIQIQQRDLAKNPLAHLAMPELQSWNIADDEKTPEQHQLAKISDQLIEEVQQADTLVIGIPMYNFGIPSTFKAWMDRIARAGVTFSYTETGPKGLLENKKVIIIATRGGVYQGTEKDSQSQHLKDFFALIGINDIEFIYAEALNMGQQQQSFERAEQQMNDIVRDF